MVSYKVFGAVTVLYATGADAFFRMECRGQLAQARMDPLMDFGTFGSHMHTIHGSSGMSPICLSSGFGLVLSLVVRVCRLPQPSHHAAYHDRLRASFAGVQC